MNFTKSFVLLIVALAAAANAQFTDFNVKSTIEENPCLTTPTTINVDTCSAGSCNSNFKIVADAAGENQFVFPTFSEKECKTADGAAALKFTCVDDKTPNSITCIGSPGKFTSFKVASTQDANTCNKTPANIKSDACVAAKKKRKFL